MYCSKCGVQIDDEAVICPKCGVATANFRKEQEPEKIVINNVNTNVNKNTVGGVPISTKSRPVALLLCIFLGYLGTHRFYVGKVGTGILYFFTGGLCGIGWIVDIIMICCRSFTDKWGRPVVR